MNDYIVSTIRTFVPSLVGAIGAWLALQDVQVDPATLSALTVALTGLLTAVYYFAVRLLAKQYPQLEWLLGSPKKPTYKG